MPSISVDEVTVQSNEIAVTGVPVGDVTPVTRVAVFIYGTEADKISQREACHRLLLLALSRPGQYVARVGSNLCSVALVKP